MMATQITIEVEADQTPFGLYKLVCAVKANAMRVVKSKPGQNLIDRRMSFIAADLVGELRNKFPEYGVYQGGHHIAIYRAGGDSIFNSRVILIAEVRS